MLYETNQNRFKICALCDNRILKDHVVCEVHLPDLELYRNDFWFQELCRMQQRQYEIDVEEYWFFVRGGNVHPNTVSTKVKSTKPRLKLSYSQKNNILSLNKQGLGWRKIAKKLNIPAYLVNKFLYRLNKRTKKMVDITNYR